MPETLPLGLRMPKSVSGEESILAPDVLSISRLNGAGEEKIVRCCCSSQEGLPAAQLQPGICPPPNQGPSEAQHQFANGPPGREVSVASNFILWPQESLRKPSPPRA